MKHPARKWTVKIAAAVLLPIPFFLLALAIGELYFRFLGPGLIPPFSNCLEYHPSLRQRYRPLCNYIAESEQGPIEYAFNEDGLRDRPRISFAGNDTVVVLGDSITEGLFLANTQTIPRRLEAKYSDIRFLNAGIRFTSPSLQLRNFIALIEPHYPVRAVVWLLNASDPTDERLFRSEALAFDEKGVPSKFPWFGATGFRALWLTRINQFNGGLSSFVNALSRLATFSLYRERIASIPPSREVLCNAIFELADRLREKKIPLLVVFTPHLLQGIETNWPGVRYQPNELATMVSCARSTGADVMDLSEYALKPELFVADKIHYNAAGTEALAEMLAPSVKKLLLSMPPGNPGQKLGGSLAR